MINTKCERKKNTIASNCLIFQEGNEHILYHGCKGNVNREKRLETTRVSRVYFTGVSHVYFAYFQVSVMLILSKSTLIERATSITSTFRCKVQGVVSRRFSREIDKQV
jgi:hypothetical protein